MTNTEAAPAYCHRAALVAETPVGRPGLFDSVTWVGLLPAGAEGWASRTPSGWRFLPDAGDHLVLDGLDLAALSL